MRTFTVTGWVVIGILAVVVAVCGILLFGCNSETRGEAMQRKAAEARELEVRKSNVLMCMAINNSKEVFGRALG